MKCPNCEQKLPEGAVSCPSCNSDLTLAGTAGQPVGPQTSGKAVASLVLGVFYIMFPVSILALISGRLSYSGMHLGIVFLLPLAPILAVMLGHWSCHDIKRSAGRLEGERVARAGLILGYCWVALSLVVAAVAVPNLLRSRLAANEASAVGSLRTLNIAVITYAETYSAGFPTSLSLLGPPPGGGRSSASAAAFVDAALAAGEKSGYRFAYTPGAKDATGKITTYAIHADPIVPGNTGEDHYYTDQSGAIRQERGRPAGPQSALLGG